jgi:hypothetical protein
VSPEDTDESDGPDAPPTEQDAVLLGALGTLLETVDPVPPGLVDRVRFVVALEDVDVEVARLVEVSELVAARADALTRLVTFECDSLTIMITIERSADGTTRIDGWLTPEARRRVELRCPTGMVAADTDDAGRFSLDAVPAGTAWLVVHGADDAQRVVTPRIEI